MNVFGEVSGVTKIDKFEVISVVFVPRCIRPHPAYWRAWHGVGLWYFVVICTMFVAPANFGREFVFLVFPHTKTAVDSAKDGTYEARWIYEKSSMEIRIMQNRLTGKRIL